MSADSSPHNALSSLSKRAQAMLAFDKGLGVSPLGDVPGSTEYHPQKNPNGLINMGTAENQLMTDLLRERLNSCFELPSEWTDELFMYSKSEGTQEIRDSIAKLLTVITRAVQPLDSDKMVILNGADVGLEAMAYTLCEAGEAILVPAPLYYGLLRSVKVRFSVDVFPIPLSVERRTGESQPFELTVERAEQAYQKALQEGVKIKAIFVVNPHNPLGDVYSRQQILDLLQFAKRHDLHVVFDEVYANTIFEDNVTHYSLFQFKEDEVPDFQKVHYIWTFSKDLAMAGMRLSMNYTWNDEVRRALTSIAHFHGTPTGWQHAMAIMLQDTDWFVNVFLPTSAKRLKEAHDFFTQGLTKLGVPFHKGTSGLFIWADFSKFLSTPSEEAELALNQRFLEVGVQMTPSLLYRGQERGWFRIVFACSQASLQTALSRIELVLKKGAI